MLSLRIDSIMKSRTILLHLSLPAVFSVCVFIYTLDKELFSLEMLVSVLLGGFLFYAAPHLLWAVLVSLIDASNEVAHSGFIASTVSLGIIASLWFIPSQELGLSMQWMMYWPLAIFLLIMFAGGTAWHRYKWLKE